MAHLITYILARYSGTDYRRVGRRRNRQQAKIELPRRFAIARCGGDERWRLTPLMTIWPNGADQSLFL